jgi:hypothetical protein
MAQQEQDLLDLLKFELKFLENGGYGRSPIPRGVVSWRSKIRQPVPTSVILPGPIRAASVCC